MKSVCYVPPWLSAMLRFQHVGRVSGWMCYWAIPSSTNFTGDVYLNSLEHVLHGPHHILLLRFEVIWIKNLGKCGQVMVARLLGLHVHPT